MAHFTPIPLFFEEAHRLADLEGVKQDFEWVLSASKKYKELVNSLDMIVIEAFSASILIRYARGHKGGKRRPIPVGWINELSAEEKKNHKYLMNLRNKFAAHSVNNFEENYTVAYIKDIESDMPEFDQVQAHHTRVLSLDEADITAITRLSSVFIEKITRQMGIESKAVTEMVEKIPVEELISKRKELPFVTASRDDAGKDRKRKVLEY